MQLLQGWCASHHQVHRKSVYSLVLILELDIEVESSITSHSRSTQTVILQYKICALHVHLTNVQLERLWVI